MPSEGGSYKFDVAFSFVQQDEHIAEELNDLLQDRYDTFLYSRRQGEIAGKDGELRFNEIFGQEARAVVVLHRGEWGQTPWTRIEETAIRNRAYDDGYDFTLFIPTEKPPSVPRWLPRTRIWFNLDRWGAQGAAAIIEQLIQLVGGEPRVESVEDRVARLQRAMRAEWDRQALLQSTEGVEKATESYRSVVGRLGHQRAVFDGASRLAVRDTLPGRYWKRRLPLEARPGAELSDAAKTLEAAIRGYFTTEEGRGRACQVDYVNDLLLRKMLADSGIDVAAGAVTRDISADTDLRLCKFFGLSEGYFLRLQNAYDTLEAKRRLSAELARIKPYKPGKAV
jgi:hypothetical protein